MASVHYFIGCILWSYLDYQNYDYIDQCFPAENPDSYKEYLDGLAKILLEYEQEVPEYEPILEKLILADEQDENIYVVTDGGEIIEEQSVRDAFMTLIDDFMERISHIQEEIVNATFFSAI